MHRRNQLSASNNQEGGSGSGSTEEEAERTIHGGERIWSYALIKKPLDETRRRRKKRRKDAVGLSCALYNYWQTRGGPRVRRRGARDKC
uniref:Uncharacterized protein n=1 Tax=Oryza brachyantha TaxID=4533 RepID=J3LDE2_ORYBR